MQKVKPECHNCKGTGWIWSTKIPGKRTQCNTCKGTGQTNYT